MGGLWFRGLVTGILCVLAGLYLILNFFFPNNLFFLRFDSGLRNTGPDKKSLI